MGILQTPAGGEAGALVGRNQDLAYVRAFLAHARADGDALFLVGESGVGKTAVLDAAAEEAAADGMRVLRAAGAEFEAELSFAGLNQVLLPLLDELERLPRGHRDALTVALGFGPGRPPAPLLVSNATLSLVRQVAANRPLLIVIDDLHWLDRASANVLGFVARRLSGSRVGFLAASRPGADSFVERAGLPEHELQPLDDESARALVAGRFPSLALRARRRLLADAQGNPLALLELAQTLTHAPNAAFATESNVLPLSRRLETLFATQIEELPKRARELLLLAALDASDDLGAFAAASRSALWLDELAPAEQARLLSIDVNRQRLTFRHPLIRSTVVGLASEDGRRRAHRTLADALVDQPDRRALHLAEATAAPNEEVAALLEQAAHRTVRRGDGVAAVAMMTRSAALSPEGADRSRRLAEAAYIDADVTGDLGSLPELLSAAQRADPGFLDSLAAACAAAHAQLYGDGDIIAAHKLLVAAIQARPNQYPPDDHALVEALNTLLYICAVAQQPELWPPFYDALGLLRGDSASVRELQLSVKVRADPVRTATPTVLKQFDEAIGSLRKETDLVRIDRIVRAGLYVDRIAEARDTLTREIDDARRGGAVSSGISALMHLGITDFASGRWREAEELSAEGLKLCDDHGYTLMRWPMLRVHALVAGGRGATETAFALSDDLLRWATPRRIGIVQQYAHHAREFAALATGDFEQAYAQVTKISAPGELPSHAGYALLVALDVVEAAVRTGRLEEAAAHVEALRAANVAAISPRLEFVVAACAALAADQNADELFRRALDLPNLDAWPLEVARVQLIYGERLRRTRAMIDSRTHLTAALEHFERLGAHPWAARAASELRASGHTKPRKADYSRDALTPQELEIAKLAAAGLTNKQIAEKLFLSHRTVGGHLHHAFPKLGVSTRAALRDALQALDEQSRETPERD